MNVSRKMLVRNLSYSFFAQGVVLVLNVLVSLVIPRFFTVSDFDFWQLFVFLASYGGFLHLGLNDGIYLRFGGECFANLDHKILGTELRISVFLQLLVGGGIVVASVFFVDDRMRIFILLLAVVYSILSNVFMFLGLLFQATNQIEIFSRSKIIYSTLLIGAIIFMLVSGFASLSLLIFLYIFARGIALFYLVFWGREIVFSKSQVASSVVAELIGNIKIGFSLMLAITMGTFILGVGRLLIDSHWGLAAFGQVSFALLLTKLFLVFVNQVSYVLFPVLRRSEVDKRREFYILARSLLVLILPVLLFSYVPLQIFVRTWIPAYEGSLEFMVFFLPLCLFEGKMQMLSNTYFKIFRRERHLLKINFFCVVLSAFLCLVGIFIFASLVVVVKFMVISLVVRSILAEIYFAKQFGVSLLASLFLELCLALAFVVSFSTLRSLVAMLVFGLAYGIYFTLHRKFLFEGRKV